MSASESCGNFGKAGCKVSEEFCVSLARYLFRESLASSCLLRKNGSLFVANIDEQVYRPGELAVFVEEGRRVRHEGPTRSVWTKGYGHLVAYLAFMLDRLRHRAFFMRKGLARGSVELPGDAPTVLPQLGHTSRKIDTGLVPIGDLALGVCGVSRHAS